MIGALLRAHITLHRSVLVWSRMIRSRHLGQYGPWNQTQLALSAMRWGCARASTLRLLLRSGKVNPNLEFWIHTKLHTSFTYMSSKDRHMPMLIHSQTCEHANNTCAHARMQTIFMKLRRHNTSTVAISQIQHNRNWFCLDCSFRVYQLFQRTVTQISHSIQYNIYIYIYIYICWVASHLLNLSSHQDSESNGNQTYIYCAVGSGNHEGLML